MAIRWPSTRGMGAPSDPRRTNPHFASFVGRAIVRGSVGPGAHVDARQQFVYEMLRVAMAAHPLKSHLFFSS